MFTERQEARSKSLILGQKTFSLWSHTPYKLNVIPSRTAIKRDSNATQFKYFILFLLNEKKSAKKFIQKPGAQKIFPLSSYIPQIQFNVLSRTSIYKNQKNNKL